MMRMALAVVLLVSLTAPAAVPVPPHRRRGRPSYSGSMSPEPPNSVGRSLNLGRPSFMTTVFSA